VYEFFPAPKGSKLTNGAGHPLGQRCAPRQALDAIAGMGFDVVYLPPVHPIGTTFRKGRNTP